MLILGDKVKLGLGSKHCIFLNFISPLAKQDPCEIWSVSTVLQSPNLQTWENKWFENLDVVLKKRNIAMHELYFSWSSVNSSQSIICRTLRLLSYSWSTWTFLCIELTAQDWTVPQQKQFLPLQSPFRVWLARPHFLPPKQGRWPKQLFRNVQTSCGQAFTKQEEETSYNFHCPPHESKQFRENKTWNKLVENKSTATLMYLLMIVFRYCSVSNTNHPTLAPEYSTQVLTEVILICQILICNWSIQLAEQKRSVSIAPGFGEQLGCL